MRKLKDWLTNEINRSTFLKTGVNYYQESSRTRQQLIQGLSALLALTMVWSILLAPQLDKRSNAIQTTSEYQSLKQTLIHNQESLRRSVSKEQSFDRRQLRELMVHGAMRYDIQPNSLSNIGSTGVRAMFLQAPYGKVFQLIEYIEQSGANIELLQITPTDSDGFVDLTLSLD